MTGNNIEYLLGIDGGGTKTEFLLTDINGREINRLVLGCSNPVNEGIERTLDILDDGIRNICSDIKYSRISLFAGIAGAKTNNNCMLISDYLSRYGFSFSDVDSDISLALETALGDSNGSILIIGTGIVGVARCDDGLHIVGGKGYMIDKGGSGYHFGSDALNCAFEYLDGRGGSKLLLSLAEKKLSKDLPSSLGDIYKGGACLVASFASIVFEAAEKGDNCALEIIERNANEIAKIINALQQITEAPNNYTVISGGLCKQKEIIHPLIQKYLNSEARVSYLEKPMVYGAVSLAKKQIKE